MELTKRTLTVLNNFRTINPSMIFSPGDVVKTMSPLQTIAAEAKLDMEIPASFCITDLARFLNTMALLEHPNLDISVERVMISNGDTRTRIQYLCGDPRRVTAPPEKPMEIQEPLIDFHLSNDHRNSLFKAMGILGLSEFAVVGDGTTLSVRSIDSDNKVKDFYSLDIGETDKHFNVIIKAANLKLLPADYAVTIGRKNGKGLSRFKGLDFPVTYFVAIDKNSTFGE